jgi:hypothetical protein
VGRWPLARRLLRDVGGQNLAAAQSFLGSLAQFGDEPRDAAAAPDRGGN